MTVPADDELRAVVSAGLDRLNRDRGGRHLGRVAAALGVHRSSVSRWHATQAVPSFERCMALADRYPEYFERNELAELLTRVALGDGHLTAASVRAPIVASSFAAVYGAAADCIEEDPANPAAREVLQTSFHLDLEDRDPVESDPFVTDVDRAAYERYKSAITRRAREGWRIRVVANAGTIGRLRVLDRMVDGLDGSDVEIRAYPMSVPLVMTPIVVCRRDVLLAHDGLRARRPSSALVLRGSATVTWFTSYFETLYDEAPFRLRTPQGIATKALAEFRRAVKAT